jgi:hypothetical protein
MGVLRAGEDIDPDSQAPHLAAQLPHVDIHPPGLFSPQGGQRAAVNAQDRDPSHPFTALIW